MSLRHAVLGLLAIEPGTGYELTQRFDLTLRNAWHASHSQIYPELAKLEAAGFAEVIEEGARRSRTWAVTDAGREELRRWLVESEPNRSQRNETGLRWFLVFLLEAQERREVLQRELANAEQVIAELQELLARVDAAGGGSAFRPLLDLGIRVDSVMLDWLREQIDATG